MLEQFNYSKNTVVPTVKQRRLVEIQDSCDQRRHISSEQSPEAHN